MDVREKLVELLQNAKSAMKSENLSCDIARNMFVVDFMMANGVTVQEWISVDDRLPEKDEIVIICTDKNFIYAGELIGDTWFLDNDSWTETVTHWMPLPEPPKGE